MAQITDQPESLAGLLGKGVANEKHNNWPMDIWTQVIH